MSARNYIINPYCAKAHCWKQHLDNDVYCSEHLNQKKVVKK